MADSDPGMKPARPLTSGLAIPYMFPHVVFWIFLQSSLHQKRLNEKQKFELRAKLRQSPQEEAAFVSVWFLVLLQEVSSLRPTSSFNACSFLCKELLTESLAELGKHSSAGVYPRAVICTANAETIRSMEIVALGPAHTDSSPWHARFAWQRFSS